MQTALKILCLLALNVSGQFSFGQGMDAGLTTRLNKILEENQIPGAMISIVQKDSIVFSGGIGYANINNEEKVTSEHLFRLGSISKSFTALGMLKVLEENDLELSTNVNAIDPSLSIANKWKENFPITIEQVLEHTAGFDDVHNDALYSNKDQVRTSCKSLVNIHNKSLYARWKPGERNAYSNPGYVLIGHLIERISKKPFDAFMKSKILDPLQMNASRFYSKQKKDMNVAQGYERLGGQLQPVPFTSVNGGPASDLCSNANEMSLFLKFLLSQKTAEGKELISTASMERMLIPQTSLAAKNSLKQGFGLGVYSSWANNHIFYGHDGGINGFSSIYLFSKTANFAVAVAVNSETDPWKLVQPILDFYVGKNTYQDLATARISDDVKQEYTGFYNFKNPRRQSTHFLEKMVGGHNIAFDENKMIVKIFYNTVMDTLYHKGSNHFYRKDEGIPFVALLKNNNKPVLWLGNDYAEKGSKLIRWALNLALLGIVMFSFFYVIIGLGQLLRTLFDKTTCVDKFNILLWLTSLLLVLYLGSFILVDEYYHNSADKVNLGTILLFVSSAAYLLLSAWSLFRSIRLERQTKFWLWYQRLTAFSLFALALFCCYNGLMFFG